MIAQGPTRIISLIHQRFLAKGNFLMTLNDQRMETYNVILGVDVSKLTLDISCAERRLHLKIENGSKGFGEFKKWSKTNSISLKEVLRLLLYDDGA
jgi:hypothetical protein